MTGYGSDRTTVEVPARLVEARRRMEQEADEAITALINLAGEITGHDFQSATPENQAKALELLSRAQDKIRSQMTDIEKELSDA